MVTCTLALQIWCSDIDLFICSFFQKNFCPSFPLNQSKTSVLRCYNAQLLIHHYCQNLLAFSFLSKNINRNVFIVVNVDF